MKVLRLSSFALLVALVLAVGAAPAFAQCQLDGCTSNCAGGCGASSFPIQHPTFGLGGNDAVLDLTATDYGPADGDTDCDSGAGTPCDNVGNIPPLRFWAYDAYTTANSGCALTTRVGSSWIINCEYDQAGCAGVSTDGYWIFSQANWATPATPGTDTGDGCISSAPNARTVIEMSWGDTLGGEGTADRDAWYIVGSVDFTGVYDFDRITGGTGANGVGDGTLAAQLVPGVSVQADCIGGPIVQGTANTVDGNFFDIPVTISDTSPAYLTEAGLNPAGTPLIAGLEIVYWQGAAAPTTGDPSVWTPALDPANPASAAPIVAHGAASTATVALPNRGSGDPYWLGARIVYADSSINTGPGANPLHSWVGRSCGPVSEGGTGPIFSVTFDSVTALRVPGGVRVTWKTTYEDDVLGFNVYRTSDPNGTEADYVIGGVEAGLGTYSLDDVTVSKDSQTYYYVREITTSGQLGDRSPVVSVTEIDDATGGRLRTSTLR